MRPDIGSSKDLKAAITNQFKGLKQIIFKELMENMTTLIRQIIKTGKQKL